MLAVGDSVAIIVAIAGAEGLARLTGAAVAPDLPLVFAPVGIFLWLVIGAMVGAFHVDERRIDCSAADEVGCLLQGTAVWTWALFLIASGSLAGPQPVASTILLWIVVVPTMLLARHLVRRAARGSNWYQQSALIVGTAEDICRLRTMLTRHPEYGIDIAATVEVSTVNDDADRVRVLTEQVEDTAADRVIFASQYEGLDERTGALRYLAERGVKVDLVPGDSEVFRSDAEIHFVEGIPFLTLPTTNRPRSYSLLKRAIDVAAASTGLILLAPLFAYCAVRIKLDSRGPVFFRQRRTGLKGRDFYVYKFRTMTADAEERRDEVARLADNGLRSGHGMFKLERDPRVTRFGAKLRRYSIDELPQLINVLRGEMSLVGPRPLPVHESEQVPDRYRARFEVKPGVTGPWQVLGRSSIPFDDMLKLDYTYVTNWSLGDDVKLLVRTLGAITHGRGAY
jgi:exopolysaccharide biosynthesis polyprenyl glycosylphosphotransferase